MKQVNAEIVAIQRVITPAGQVQLKGLISDHAAKTGSARAKALLADWDAAKDKFWQLVPPAEKVGGRGGFCCRGAAGGSFWRGDGVLLSSALQPGRLGCMPKRRG